jgi:hypothetical protein
LALSLFFFFLANEIIFIFISFLNELEREKLVSQSTPLNISIIQILICPPTTAQFIDWLGKLKREQRSKGFERTLVVLGLSRGLAIISKRGKVLKDLAKATCRF